MCPGVGEVIEPPSPTLLEMEITQQITSQILSALSHRKPLINIGKGVRIRMKPSIYIYTEFIHFKRKVRALLVKVIYIGCSFPTSCFVEAIPYPTVTLTVHLTESRRQAAKNTCEISDLGLPPCVPVEMALIPLIEAN